MAIIETKQRLKDGKTKPTRSYSSNQEKHIANEFNGQITKNSGATMFQKGDILLDDFLLEAKTRTTDKDSISIKKEWLEKNLKEALFMGKKYNALLFNFGPSSQKNYVIIDEETFKEFLNKNS
jgi:hypothetical protein